MSRIDDHLLPANSTALEQELARLSGRLDAIEPGVIARIWDAWSCPSALLPWLAWALSVDHWDEQWPEIVKRQAIAESPLYHRRKGTVAAVQSIIALAGLPYTLTEWWQRQPEGRRGTALVHIETPTEQVGEVTRRIRPLLLTSKPKSRAVFLGVGEAALAPVHIGAGLLDESLTTIEPYSYDGEDVDGTARLGIGLLTETLTTIEASA
jgi:phage tail P2-like protein